MLNIKKQISGLYVSSVLGNLPTFFFFRTLDISTFLYFFCCQNPPILDA